MTRLARSPGYNGAVVYASIVCLSLLSFSLFKQAAGEEVVHLKNGDVFHGTVLTVGAKTVTLKTPYGRLIIPKYDTIWVASLVAWLVAIPLYWEAVAAGLGYSGPFSNRSEFSTAYSRMESWELSLAPLAVTLMLLALFLMGPGLHRWRLVGQHRVVFAQNRKEFIEL